MILHDLWLPALGSVWCFAFQYRLAFMASSCVQRCGSSNKEPFNFAHISIKRKENAAAYCSTPPPPPNTHTCALSPTGQTRSVSRASTNTRRGDIDILLLVVYLWFSLRLSANGGVSPVSCNKRVLGTTSCHKRHIGLLSKQRCGLETRRSQGDRLGTARGINFN